MNVWMSAQLNRSQRNTEQNTMSIISNSSDWQKKKMSDKIKITLVVVWIIMNSHQG